MALCCDRAASPGTLRRAIAPVDRRDFVILGHDVFLQKQGYARRWCGLAALNVTQSRFPTRTCAASSRSSEVHFKNSAARSGRQPGGVLRTVVCIEDHCEEHGGHCTRGIGPLLCGPYTNMHCSAHITRCSVRRPRAVINLTAKDCQAIKPAGIIVAID